MTGDDVVMYLLGDKEPGRVGAPSTPIGRFVFRDVQAGNRSTSEGLRLNLEFTCVAGAGKAPKWLAWLQARVESARIPPRVCGELVIEANEWPVLGVESNQSLRWEWHLRSDELEKIELETAPGDRWRQFALQVAGIAQLGGEVRRVAASSQFRIPLSEWEDLLRSLGYGVPPTETELAGIAVRQHPSWPEAEHRLAEARRALRAGETHAALTVCLDQFSALADQPYREDSWRKYLPADPEQKQTSLARLLAAHCTYLNRIGYHRDRDHPDGSGLAPVPVDQWEAEIALAASQYWLTLALRATGLS